MAITPLEKLKERLEAAEAEYFEGSGHQRDCACEDCTEIRAVRENLVAWATSVAGAIDKLKLDKEG